MKIDFTEKAWADYLWWQTQDRKILKRINKLIADIERSGHGGLGKPEPLIGDYSGLWSRRIDDKNRLVYKVEDNLLTIFQCRLHYGDK